MCVRAGVNVGVWVCVYVCTNLCVWEVPESVGCDSEPLLRDSL